MLKRFPGANVNCRDRWGGSPLRGALLNRREDVAVFLKENGAHVKQDIVFSGQQLVHKVNKLLPFFPPPLGQSSLHFPFQEEELEALKGKFNIIEKRDANEVAVVSLERYLLDAYGLDARVHKSLKQSIREISVGNVIPWKNFEKAMRDHSGHYSFVFIVFYFYADVIIPLYSTTFDSTESH